MIEVSNLSKSFGSVRALDRVSFGAEEGEILGFLGPNGAGKSTAMRILTAFLPGDSGHVRVAGYDVQSESIQVRRSTGYLPEGVPLYPEMRVLEYLRFRARLKGLPRSRRQVRIGRVMEDAGEEDVKRRLIGTLSRGYRQRVGLADALLAEPRVLILDEPTVGLDPEQVRQFRQVLRLVGRDRTVILSTHILSEVELVCSRVVIINKGRVVARDTAANLRQRFGSAERVVAEVAGPIDQIQEALSREPRLLRVTATKGDVYHRFSIVGAGEDDSREVVFRLVRDGGWLLRELRQETTTLEDVFVEVVGGAVGSPEGGSRGGAV